MQKDDTVAAGMDRDDMKRLFRIARDQPVQTAFAVGPDKQAVLLMDKRKPGRALDRELRGDVAGGRDHNFGTVMIDAADPKLAVFTVERAVTGVARKLVKLVKGTGITKVRMMLADGTVCEAADDSEEGGGDGGNPLDAAGQKSTLTALVQRIAGVIAADPSRRETLLKLAGDARDQILAGSLAEAASAIAALRQALDQSPAPSAAPAARDVAFRPSPGGAPQAAMFVGMPANSANAPAAPGGPGDAAPAPGAPPGDPSADPEIPVPFLVPKDAATLDDAFRAFERNMFGRELKLKWAPVGGGTPTIEAVRGKRIIFMVRDSMLRANTDPALAQRQKDDKNAADGLAGAQKAAVQTEAARRFIRATGEKPGPDAAKPGTVQARYYDQALSTVMQDRDLLKKLPPEVASLLGGQGGEYDPKTYTQLLRIVDKLKAFTPEDLKLYKMLPLRATDDLNLFEQSIDVFLAHKEELRKAIAAQQPADPSQPPPKDPVADVWNDFDGAKLGAMTDDQREELARRKANELAEAQMKQMAAHPGDTMVNFAKSATLMNTPETMSAIGKDISEAADGDANAFARLGAGAGAGAKLSGWLMAAAGVLYVASWLTGVGELATIAAAGVYLLGANITLSIAESELRIKAASQAKTPEEFKHNVEAAAAARVNIALCVAMIVVAAVLHFTAKALFPEQVAKLKTAMKNLREKIRLKGAVSELKPAVLQEMAAQKAGLAKAAEAAKAHATDTARELDGLSTEQFAERLRNGSAGGFLDQSKVPAEQKVDFGELLKSEEGRKAIDAYKQKLVQALRTDVIAQIDALAKQYADSVDGFMKEVEAAKNHDELGAATDKLDDLLSEDHAKQFMKGEQDKLVAQKLRDATAEAEKEVAQAPANAAAKRVTERIAKSTDPSAFKVTYTPDEIMAILKKGKELGIPDKTVEDLILTASREAKRISAADLQAQMDNWVNTVSKRGYPYKFKSAEEFARFSADLKSEVAGAGLPADDVRVQGSSLRKPTADDVDLVVVIDAAKFDEILVKRFDNRVAFSENAPVTPKAKIQLSGLTHAELLDLARDIMANKKNYNATAKTFGNAMQQGLFPSTSEISATLKTAGRNIAAKYPDLNVKSVSVMVKGSSFDLTPELPIK